MQTWQYLTSDVFLQFSSSKDEGESQDYSELNENVWYIKFTKNYLLQHLNYIYFEDKDITVFLDNVNDIYRVKTWTKNN